MSDAPTGRSAGSLAWAGLANTYYWIDQKKGVGGVYVTQVLPFADVKSLPLFYAFERRCTGARPKVSAAAAHQQASVPGNGSWRRCLPADRLSCLARRRDASHH